MRRLTFPDDYLTSRHPVVPGATQFKPLEGTQPVFISVVGGGTGLYGDGVNTFELMIGNRVHGYLTPDGINEKVNEVLELIN